MEACNNLSDEMYVKCQENWIHYDQVMMFAVLGFILLLIAVLGVIVWAVTR
jgi:hypothetical protein